MQPILHFSSRKWGISLTFVAKLIPHFFGKSTVRLTNNGEQFLVFSFLTDQFSVFFFRGFLLIKQQTVSSDAVKP